MTILQWNCRGLTRQLDDLRLLMSTVNPDCVCLQETKCKPSDGPRFRGYNIIRKDFLEGDIACGGVAILLRSSVIHSPISLTTPLQAVAVRTNLWSSLTICTLYLNPAVPIRSQELESLLDQLPRPVLLLGDFNGHNTLWGCTATDSRGRTIENCITAADLVLLNTGSATHFSTASGKLSAIDLSFATPSLAPFVHWTVLSDLHGSDHYPVNLQIQDPLQSQPSCQPRWCFRRANWRKYASSLQLPDVASATSVDTLVAEFSSAVLTAAHASIPLTTGVERRPYVPWWNDDCKRAIRDRRKALRSFFSAPTPANRLTFLRLRAKARQVVRESKRRTWIAYISTLNRSTPVSWVWGKLRRIAGKGHPPLTGLTVSGTVTTDPTQIAKSLGDAFSTVSSSASYDLSFLCIKDQAEKTPLSFSSRSSGNLPYNQPFTLWELEAAIQAAKDSAPGPDGIHYQMLRNLPPLGLQCLLDLVNFIWSTGTFPASWQEALVIPIPKPGKDTSRAENYRPIALTSCLCKILERMINWRLLWYLESRRLLTKSQCGFRRHRSTIDHLVTLETAIREAFSRRQHLIAVFFDIEKAYDTAWRFGILRILHQWGIRGNLGIFLENFLRERTFRVKFGTTISKLFLQENGVPQGSVLSTTLFAVAINPIADIVRPPAYPTLFVDDLAAYSAGHSLPAVERRLQLTLNRLYKWSCDNGFRFSSSKTVCVHFHRIRGLFPPPTLYLDATVLPVHNTVRFLGLLFDTKLTWLPHIRSLRDRCVLALNTVRSVASTSWGADRTVLLHMYHAYVRSKLDYACFIYGSATTSALRPLDTVHHRGLRLATGAFRSSPIPSLYAESGVPPLAIRREALLLSYVARLSSLPDNPATPVVLRHQFSSVYDHRPSFVPPLSLRLRRLLTSLGVSKLTTFPIGFSKVPPWMVPRPHFDRTLLSLPKDITSPLVYRAQAMVLLQSYSDRHMLYTDGSKSGDSVGYAVILPDRSFGYRLHPLCSNYTAELLAIRQALRLVLYQPQNKYLVLSDSAASLQAICRLYPNCPLVQHIQELLSYISTRGGSVDFCWVPGHVGIPGNEAADAEAYRVAHSPVRHLDGVLRSDYQHYLTNKAYNQWKITWRNTTGNKLRLIKDTTSVWASSLRQIRREEVVLTRVRPASVM